jgi:hypothetical protein
MLRAAKFAILILVLAGTCRAQDGSTVDNQHQERVSTPEAERFTPRLVRSFKGSSGLDARSIHRSDLFWVPTRPRYGLQDEKSGLLNGIATLSHRESFGCL